MKEKIVAAFSSGKDSAFLLGRLLNGSEYEVVSLITTCTNDGKTTSHHINEILLEQQAERIGIPLYKIKMELFNTEQFENGLINAMHYFRKEFGVTKIAYGDLFLEDVKVYKEKLLAQYGYELVVPLWGENTSELVVEIIKEGYKAVIVSVDTERLPVHYLGKTLNAALVESFPADIDPCGENGEYHTFVFDGPIFSEPVPFTLSKNKNNKDRWVFADVK